MELETLLNERRYRKKVLRNGKLIWKWKTDRPRYKIVDGKEVRMKQSEMRARKRSARRGKRKRKAKSSIIQYKMARARRRRQQLGFN